MTRRRSSEARPSHTPEARPSESDTPEVPCAAYDVAVLDWGIGGFGFVRAFQSLHPESRLVYFSDSGRTPYGLMPVRELRPRLGEIALWARDHGARHLVVACNAASSALGADAYALPVLGIVEAGVMQVYQSGYQRVAILGGRRTVLSGAYARPLRAHGLEVVQRIAQPLSALVEAGELTGPRVEATLTKITRGLGDVDAVVLACTHYPAIAPAIQAHLPGVGLLDPAVALARSVPPPAARGGASLTCYTTGSPESSRRTAEAAFGLDPGPFFTVL